MDNAPRLTKTSLLHFTFALWRRAREIEDLNVNDYRSENDSHSAFFLETKKIPISEDLLIFKELGWLG